MCWINPTTATQGTGHILSSVSTNPRHYLYFNKTLRVHAGHGNPLQARVADPNAITINTWHHFALTYNNNTNRMMLYRNGQPVQSVNVAALAWTGGGPCQIGGLAGANSCRALLDSVRVYDRALTHFEVTDAYIHDGGTVYVESTIPIPSGTSVNVNDDDDDDINDD